MVPSEYTWHVSPVHKHVLKLVNFEVQKVQKPHVFDLVTWVVLIGKIVFLHSDQFEKHH